VLGVLVVPAVVAGLFLTRPGTRPRPASVSAEGPTVQAAAVLREWDAARAEAWAAGSVRSLRRLYVDGAGARDVRLLRDYLRRGLSVHGLRVQVLALDVLRHRPGEWRLRVTDRLAAGAVVTAGHGSGTRRPLPRDQATTREVVLVRDAGAWRVAEVVPLE
jgi:hypothetical protein